MAMRLSRSSLSRGCKAPGGRVVVGALGVAPSVAFQSCRGYASMSRSGLGLGSRSTYAGTQIRYRCNQGYKNSQGAVPALLAPTRALVPPVLSSATRRGYADLNPSSGKTEADLLVEELQDLYDIAKDEFEIATDSTNDATIYAASDRESARDALNHLTRVYTLYTEMTTSSASDTPAQLREGDTAPNPTEPVLQNPQESIAEGRTDPLLSGDPAAGPPMQGDATGVVGIAPNYDPELIQPEVKEEVKRRVGQRIRELQNAVQALEEAAHSQE